MRKRLCGSEVSEGEGKFEGVRLKCQVKSSNLVNSEVKSSSFMNEKVESSVLSGKVMVKRKNDCFCGNKVELMSRRTVEDLVKLFEHVNKSGHPNYKCCRIPVSAASLKIEVWREKLTNY